jgi:REP element-mobilizing transposase RayT
MSIFYAPYSPKDITRGDLPHWSQQGSLHFVTFRLADSLPAERVAEMQAERESWHRCHQGSLTAEEEKEYANLFHDRVEGWLDAGSGECILAQELCSQAVAGAIEFFAGKRYLLDHWVIMPNHIHVLAMPLAGYSLATILHSWKSFTSHEMNKKMGRSGQVWQHESFDHIVRSHQQLTRFREYIIKNAVSASKQARLSTEKMASGALAPL